MLPSFCRNDQTSALLLRFLHCLICHVVEILEGHILSNIKACPCKHIEVFKSESACVQSSVVYFENIAKYSASFRSNTICLPSQSESKEMSVKGYYCRIFSVVFCHSLT